ncbi:MAG TPA: hypothetical protein VFS95_12130 [Telluria sp.]|nr:hypothetical protein [Telluria sp.]
MNVHFLRAYLLTALVLILVAFFGVHRWFSFAGIVLTSLYILIALLLLFIGQKLKSNETVLGIVVGLSCAASPILIGWILRTMHWKL